MTNLYGNIELIFNGEKIDYVLSVGIDLEREGHPRYMPSLAFYKHYGLTHDQKEIEVWDSEDYLINRLYKGVLVPWENNEIKDKECLVELVKDIEGISLSDFDGLKRLFEISFTVNFFNNV